MLTSACIFGCGGPPFPSELVDFDEYAANPVFSPGPPGAWDHYFQERGWVLKEGDAYRMWYSGRARSGLDCAPDNWCRVGLATSSDGLAWSRDPRNPIYDGALTEDEQVLHDGGRYYMFTEGLDDFAQQLTSEDGITWTRTGTLDIRKHDGTPLDPGPFGTPVVWHERDTWYLFYERRDDAVWLATSTDRSVWVNVQDDPVLTLGPGNYDDVEIEMIQIIAYGGRYYVYYDSLGSVSTDWSSSIATSTDFVHWDKYPGNPLVGANRTAPILVDDGARFRLYTMAPAVEVRFARQPHRP
jgi:hypothetical protein